MSAQGYVVVSASPPQPLAWDVDPEMLGTPTPLQPPKMYYYVIHAALPRRVAQLRGDQPERRHEPPVLPRPTRAPRSPLCPDIEAMRYPHLDADALSQDELATQQDENAAPHEHTDDVHLDHRSGSTPSDSSATASPPTTPESDAVSELSDPPINCSQLVWEYREGLVFPLDDPRYVPIVPDEQSTFIENAVYIRWAATKLAYDLGVDSLEELGLVEPAISVSGDGFSLESPIDTDPKPPSGHDHTVTEGRRPRYFTL